MIVQIRFEKGDEHWVGMGRPGETIFDVAQRCEAPVQTLCGGIGTCVQCKVRLDRADQDALELPNAIEKDRLGNTFHLTGERLSCQAKIRRDVTVEVLDPNLTRSRRSRSRNRPR